MQQMTFFRAAEHIASGKHWVIFGGRKNATNYSLLLILTGLLVNETHNNK